MAFVPWLRRFTLLVHVVTSVGFIGAVAGFLALAVAGAASSDQQITASVYLALPILTWWVIVPLAAASLLVGIVQSLGTPWGLFRYYWVIAKLVITLIALVVLLLQTSTIERLRGAALAGQLADLTGAKAGMVLHSAGGMLILVLATLLSVYKPRGLTGWGVSPI